MLDWQSAELAIDTSACMRKSAPDIMCRVHNRKDKIPAGCLVLNITQCPRESKAAAQVGFDSSGRPALFNYKLQYFTSPA